MTEKKAQLPRGGALLRPTTAEGFEQLTRALFSALYQDLHADLHGRNGQDQGGIDVICKDRRGRRVGVQCKLSVVDPDKPPSLAALRRDVEAARTAHPDLARFVFLSTAPNDAQLQVEARRLDQENRQQGLFEVEYHGWGWIEDTLRSYPQIILDHGLAARLESAPTPPTVMQTIGQRLLAAIAMINLGRDPGDPITLPRLARLLDRADWRDLEAMTTGASTAAIEELHAVAVGLGLRPEWLIEGREEPFSREEDLHDAERQYWGILALTPQRIVFVRSKENPYFALVAAQLDAVRWRVFDYHPAGPDVGGAGRSQLFAFCCLIRRLHGHYGLAVQFGGQQVCSDDFQDLLSGTRHPGEILDATWNDPWWQDFAELNAKRIEMEDMAAEALIKAIAVTSEVLAEYQAKVGTPYWADRLREAHLPDRPGGSLLMTLPEENVSSTGATAPQAPLRSEWPKVMALKLEAATFWFDGANDGSLLRGQCDIDIVNLAKIPLHDCSVVLTAIIDGTGPPPVDLPRRLAPETASAKGKGSTLRPGAKLRLPLAKRNLTDIINRPPWILNAEGATIGLEDGKTHTLWLELRSNYDFPTRVQLVLRTGHARDVTAVIARQSV